MQIPPELIRSLQSVPGFDEQSFKAVHESGRQVTSIRLNPRKVHGNELLAFPGRETAEIPAMNLMTVPWCPHGRYLTERPSFTLDPLLHAGAYYVQEASSMFLWHVLQAVTGPQHQVVLDLCAAPGGKSTLLSSFFREGVVVSNEVIRSRVNILQENITKWGDENVVVTSNDSKDFPALEAFFDVIVADVPCSGSGLFRRDPAAIDEWSPGNVNLCCQRQQRILADIIPCLKTNGLLIYSTCSYSREEDEDILDFIVGEFGLVPVEVPVPADWNVVVSTSAKHKATGYRFFPDKLEGEGFFISAFRREDERPQKKLKEAGLDLAGTKETEALKKYVQLPGSFLVFNHGDTMHAMPARFIAVLRVLAGQLYIRQAGIALGGFKGKSFVPDHALALSSIPNGFPQVEVSLEHALAYLRKQDTHFLAPEGWCRVSYNGHGLGWIKNLINRANNYYPSAWRILKT